MITLFYYLKKEPHPKLLNGSVYVFVDLEKHPSLLCMPEFRLHSKENITYNFHYPELVILIL